MVGLWLILACGSAVAQTGEPGDGLVSGTVIDAATGRPLAAAQVVLRVSYANYGFRDRLVDRPMPADSARAITDDSGRFSIPFDLDSPASLLFVSHEGFRSEDNRDIAVLGMRPSGARNILVRLIPQSLISGKIADTDGNPLPGIMVQAIREELRDGVREYRRNFATAVTGRNGEYRLTALTAGIYRLEATGSAPDSKHGYGPVYFPDSAEAKDAAPVRVGPGESMTADFTLASHPTFQIRGIININSPVRRVALRLLRGDEPINASSGVNLGTHTFQIDAVPSGSYRLQAYTPDSFPPDFGEAAIAVADADVSKVQISMNPAIDIHGRIEFKGAKNQERYAFVVAEPMTPYPLLRAAPAARAMMEPGGTFLLHNLLPGRYRLSVKLTPDSYVESILAGNTDVQQNGFTVGTGRAPDLRITIRRGGGAVEGSVEGVTSTAAVPVLVVQKHGSTQTMSLIRADGGRFLAAGLAPGDYALYALPAIQQIEYKNPDVLAGFSEFATQISVKDGVREFVTLKPVPPPF
jgi:hypothetical protein